MSQEQLITENMNLVYSVVRKHYPTFIGDEDIIQCGMIGLCLAAKSWDSGKGEFSTYAWKCIRNEINHEFRRRSKCPPTLSLEYEMDDGEGGTATLRDLIVGESDIEYLDNESILRQLNRNEKVVFELLKSGLTTSDVANATGLHIETVRKHIRKIKLLLRG